MTPTDHKKREPTPLAGDPATHRTVIDHAAPQALYVQIKNYILEHIRSGEWPPGARVPSEPQLVDALGVSRMTANRALRELTHEGHLERIHGVGTFVREQPPPLAFLEVKSIADEIAGWGGRHRARVHLLRKETAGETVAASMGLAPGSRVFHSVIVHMDRSRPVQLSDRFVNPSVAPGYLDQDFTRITPNAYLTRVAPIQETEHVVEAVLPDPLAQQLLGIAPTEPCLRLNRRTWSFDQVATRALLLYPGSRYRLGGRFVVQPL